MAELSQEQIALVELKSTVIAMLVQMHRGGGEEAVWGYMERISQRTSLVPVATELVGALSGALEALMRGGFDVESTDDDA